MTESKTLVTRAPSEVLEPFISKLLTLVTDNPTTKGSNFLATLGGCQDMTTLFEPGLYALILLLELPGFQVIQTIGFI